MWDRFQIFGPFFRFPGKSRAPSRQRNGASNIEALMEIRRVVDRSASFIKSRVPAHLRIAGRTESWDTCQLSLLGEAVSSDGEAHHGHW